MTIEPDTDLFLRAVVRLAMDELTFGLSGEPEDPTVAPAARVLPIVARHLRRAQVGAFDPGRIVDMIRQLTASGALVWLEQQDRPADAGRIFDLNGLAEVRLPHRLSAAEVERHFLDVDPDLSVLARLAESDGGLHDREGWPLVLRTRLEPTGGAHRARRLLRRLFGPAGWLDGLAAGDLVRVTVAGGVVELTPNPAVGDAGAPALEAAATALRAAFDAASTHGHPQGLGAMQATGLVDGWFPLPEADGPGVPFGALIGPAGLEHDGADLGRPDGWDEYAQVVERISRHARHLDHLTADEARLMADALTAFEHWLADRTTTPPADLVARLTRLPQALACGTEELRGRTAEGTDIEAFAAALPATSRAGRAVVDHLISVGAGMDGRAADSVAALERALAADLIPARAAHADLLSERGDAAGALRELGSIYELDEAERAQLRARTGEPPHPVGRNEPCWCGSGRKFKQCHLGRSEVDRAVLVSWLVDKARTFVERYGPLHVLTDLVATTVRPTAHIETVAMDIALFDEGWFDRFLDARGELLPPDEVALGRTWVGGQREGMFRVVASAPDHVVLEPLGAVDGAGGEADPGAGGAGGQVRVERSGPTPGLDPGTVAWWRLLPDGDRWWSAGVVLRQDDDQGAARLAAARRDRNWAMVVSLATDEGDRDVVDPRTGRPQVVASSAWLLDAEGSGAAAIRAALGADPTAHGHGDDAWSQVTDDGVSDWDLEDDRVLLASSSTRAMADRAASLVAELAPGAELDHVRVTPHRVEEARRRAHELLVSGDLLPADELDDEYDDFDDDDDLDEVEQHGEDLDHDGPNEVGQREPG